MIVHKGRRFTRFAPVRVDEEAHSITLSQPRDGFHRDDQTNKGLLIAAAKLNDVHGFEGSDGGLVNAVDDEICQRDAAQQRRSFEEILFVRSDSCLEPFAVLYSPRSRNEALMPATIVRAAVSMNYRMAPGDSEPRDPIQVVGYNATPGDDFKVYYSLEAPAEVAPCHDTRPDIGGWVCK